ncbi:MAG: geranylgeranyl reductase family protein, partial [Dehalococcoidia bacterium]
LAGVRRLRSGFVVGADGANSTVARATGLGKGMAESVALEAEVCASADQLDRWRGVLNVDFGYRPWGYGWVFPKERRLSVGLVLPRGAGGTLRGHLNTYLKRLHLEHAEVERVVGHKLLFRHDNEPIAGDGVLLAGDAAGLADEFTEEGIYYAIQSGVLAASAIRRALLDGGASLIGYQRLVDREIMPELRAAWLIARMFYGTLRLSPRLMIGMSRRIAYFWDAFFRVQRGITGYDDELNRAWWLRPALPLLRHAG